MKTTSKKMKTTPKINKNEDDLKKINMKTTSKKNKKLRQPQKKYEDLKNQK